MALTEEFHIFCGFPTAGCICRLGLALFDLYNPEVLLRRGIERIFAPDQPYEQRGDVANAVFPCAYTIGRDRDSINIYDGAADKRIALATSSIRQMLEWLEEQGN